MGAQRVGSVQETRSSCKQQDSRFGILYRYHRYDGYRGNVGFVGLVFFVAYARICRQNYKMAE